MDRAHIDRARMGRVLAYSYTALGKLFNLSVPQTFICKMKQVTHALEIKGGVYMKLSTVSGLCRSLASKNSWD